MSADADSTIGIVRARTRLLHERLERRLGFGERDLTHAKYVAYLERMLGIVDAVEGAISIQPELEATLPDVRVRNKKSALLRADLRELDPTRANDDVTPRPALPPTETLAALFGVLYVLEGSTLGGALVARAVEGALGPGSPTRYLRCYGEALGSMWKTFCAALERVGEDGAARALVATRAAETFEAVERWLDAGGLLAKEHQ